MHPKITEENSSHVHLFKSEEAAIGAYKRR